MCRGVALVCITTSCNIALMVSVCRPPYTEAVMSRCTHALIDPKIVAGNLSEAELASLVNAGTYSTSLVNAGTYSASLVTAGMYSASLVRFVF